MYIQICIFSIWKYDTYRAFLLWYAVKLERCKQNTLIKRHLLTESYMTQFQQTHTNNTNNTNEPGLNRQRSMFDIAVPSLTKQTEIKTPCLYKYAPFFAQPKRIFTVFESILLLYCIIIAITTSQSSTHTLANSLQVILIIVLFSTMTYLASSLWCCSNHENQQLQFQDDIERINTNSTETSRNNSNNNGVSITNPQLSVSVDVHNNNNSMSLSRNKFEIHPGLKFRDDFNFRFVFGPIFSLPRL